MKKLFGVAQLEETRSCASPIKTHDELRSFGRFWYEEIRDFLNSKHTAMAMRAVFFPAGVGFVLSNPHWNHNCNRITKTRT
jgi:hypothetical protein